MLLRLKARPRTSVSGPLATSTACRHRCRPCEPRPEQRNPTRKSVPPRARKRSESGRVREGQNSRIRRPSESGHFLIEVLFKIGRFWARAGPGPVWGVFGGSKTGCPKGRPETPPRRSTTRSKSTRSSRLCSVSLSSVLFCLVLRRDVVVGKFFCLRPEVGLDFLLRPQVGLQHSHSTFDRSRWTRSRCRSVRSSSVNRRRATVDFGRIQKPARHRSRSENS